MTCITTVNKSSEKFFKKVCLQISFKNIKAFYGNYSIKEEHIYQK